MNFRFQKEDLPICALIAVLIFGCTSQAFAKKVSINFDDYHGYTATVKYLKDVAKANPNITELIEIGKSNMGRPIYVLVVSNMKTGTTIDAHVELRNMRKEGAQNVEPMKNHQGKPGHWICGSTHGNEFTGTEVCLYIIDKLVSGYGSEKDITEMVDKIAFYICPIVNPDGVYNSIEQNIPHRQNSMMEDDDGDGKINEDGPDDLNGDGYITHFRCKDDTGRYIIDDLDPRLMIRLKEKEETAKQRYSVYIEDKDNDGDGKRGEDSERGIDLNRNFPEGWFTDDGMMGGKGDYPTSAPESHAIAEFFTNYRNILMAQFYHTSGGFTFRPLGTAPHDKLHPKDVAVFDFIMGKKYLEIIREEVPEAWLQPDSLEKFKAKLRRKPVNKYAKERGYELPRGWRVSYNEKDDKRYNYGMATDWAYLQYGMYSLTTELWNFRKDIQDFPAFEGDSARIISQRALLKYQDENYDGKLFVPWKIYKHPELGEGQIGGWIPKYRNNALPGEPLRTVCENHWQFELFRAQLLPEVEITDAQAKVLYTTNNANEAKVLQSGDQVTIKKGKSKGKYKIVEVTANIENVGKLPTHIARGATLAGLREDAVWLIGDRGKITFLQGTAFQQMGVLEGEMKIPGYKEKEESGQEERRQRTFRMRRMPMGYPMQRRIRRSEDEPEERQKGPKREMKWLIAVEGDTTLKIVVTSQKGGTKVKNLAIN